MWLDQIRDIVESDLEINWKHFSLEEINNIEGAGQEIWKLADRTIARSLLAQMALEAASLQGREAMDRYFLAMLIARHGGQGRIPLNKTEPLLALAKDVGLDSERIRRDMYKPSVVEAIERDHRDAVMKYGVFGTPTFIFDGDSAVYLKTFTPPESDSLTFFEQFVAISANNPHLGELKRPQPPWPRGFI